MIKGYCRWNFPKEYSSATQMTEDGYPLYRQRGPEMGGNSFEKYYHGKKFTYTNAWVVPYNKYLLFKYNCHINVEYCCPVYAITIKYHLKYIHKGNDQATLGVEDANNEDAEERNEVEEFKNKRYVSGGEAAWRNRGNELAERKPAVSRLQIHLP